MTDSCGTFHGYDILGRGPPLSAAEVFDADTDPVSIFALDGTYVYINDAGQQLLGRSASELLGRTYLQVFPEIATHPYHAAFMRVASGQSKVERLEFYYAPMERWSSQQLRRVSDYIVVYWADVTARMLAQQSLDSALTRAAENERLFREMIEWMPQLAWWARPDGFIEYYNPRWYEYTGTRPQDMEGWGWQSIHDPAALPAVMTRWQRSIATGEPFEMEFPLRRHDGVFRMFLTRVSPVRDKAGEIMRWIGVNVDIDEQKRAIELMGDTLESMSDAFLLLDREWRIVMVNQHQEAASQVPRARSIGRSHWEVFPEAVKLRYWDEYHRVMTERVAAHFEEYYAPLDLWTEVDAFPSRDGGMAIFFRDVSERKRAELHRTDLLQREREARAAAESANRAKDEFMAMLSHELRNPLAPILTALHLLRMRGSSDSERERNVIERQVNHLVRLVDDLLDVSKFARGKIELTRVRVDLAELTGTAIEMASPLIEQRQHRLFINVPAGLVVDADAHRLAQVVANLLTNAAKYTPPGGLIELVGARRGAEVVLEVSDSGNGIAPSLLPYVFDLFVQGRQDLDRPQGGLGLGLTIVRQLVELHGGRVTAISDGPGRGASFSVYLPAREQPVAAASYEVAAAESSAITPGAGRRVLVVDDNEDAAEMLAEYLNSLGYTTRTALDGPSALALFDEFAPDAAVLDIGLPVMNGYELARRIRGRADAVRLRLIAVTGYGQPSDRERTAAAGFDAHLVKPVDIEALIALIGVPSKPKV